MEKMINCKTGTLEDLFLDSPEWNTVIKSLNHVRVAEKREDLDLSDFADPTSVLPIIEEAGINIHYNSPVVDNLVSGQKVVSSYPRDLFVAQVEEEDARKMAGRNGVLVVSSDNPSLDQIKRPVLPIELKKGANNSWHNIFLCLTESPRVPINSLVIIDRYLFVRYSQYGWRQGINNLTKILSEALPMQFSDRFDVLIITSDERLDTRGGGMDDIIYELNEQCQELRSFDINLEVLVLKKQLEGERYDELGKRIWEESHDRRLISNYYRISATKGFFAFVGSKTNEVLRTQVITVDCAFSNIDNKYAQRLGFPIKGYDDTLTEIYRFVLTHGKSSSSYQFYKNGSWKKDLSTFENRIVMQRK